LGGRNDPDACGRNRKKVLQKKPHMWCQKHTHKGRREKELHAEPVLGKGAAIPGSENAPGEKSQGVGGRTDGRIRRD